MTPTDTLTADQYRNRIDRLLVKAECGEDWAEIARLEGLMIAAGKAERNAHVHPIFRDILNAFSAGVA